MEPLLTALQSFDQLTKMTAAQALGEIKDPRAVGPLIAALKENCLRVYGPEALKKITGKDFRNQNEKWQSWWDLNYGLIKAVKENKPEPVRELLKSGTEINAIIDTYPALTSAAKQGNLEITQILIKAGADPNARDINGYTALIWAVIYERVEIMPELIKAGTKVNLKGDDENTALDLATVALANGLEMVKLLIKANADVNVRRKDGHTALMYAANTGDVAIAELLIKAKANVNEKTINGVTPLMFEVVKLLIKAKIDINAAQPNGLTALQLANRNGHTEVAALLKEAGASE